MRMVVKGVKWRRVTRGIPQGSVLGPIMILIYINDMPAGVKSYTSMFVDDAKIMRRIRNVKDCNMLQDNLNKICNWSVKWQMVFDINKSHVMRIDKSKYILYKEYQLRRETIDEVWEEKDLEVIIQNKLSPEKHSNRIYFENLQHTPKY